MDRTDDGLFSLQELKQLIEEDSDDWESATGTRGLNQFEIVEKLLRSICGHYYTWIQPSKLELIETEEDLLRFMEYDVLRAYFQGHRGGDASNIKGSSSTSEDLLTSKERFFNGYCSFINEVSSVKIRTDCLCLREVQDFWRCFVVQSRKPFLRLRKYSEQGEYKKEKFKKTVMTLYNKLLSNPENPFLNPDSVNLYYFMLSVIFMSDFSDKLRQSQVEKMNYFASVLLNMKKYKPGKGNTSNMTHIIEWCVVCFCELESQKSDFLCGTQIKAIYDFMSYFSYDDAMVRLMLVELFEDLFSQNDELINSGMVRGNPFLGLKRQSEVLQYVMALRAKKDQPFIKGMKKGDPSKGGRWADESVSSDFSIIRETFRQRLGDEKLAGKEYAEFRSKIRRLSGYLMFNSDEEDLFPQQKEDQERIWLSTFLATIFAFMYPEEYAENNPYFFSAAEIYQVLQGLLDYMFEASVSPEEYVRERELEISEDELQEDELREDELQEDELREAEAVTNIDKWTLFILEDIYLIALEGTTLLLHMDELCKHVIEDFSTVIRSPSLPISKKVLLDFDKTTGKFMDYVESEKRKYVLLDDSNDAKLLVDDALFRIAYLDLERSVKNFFTK